MLVDHRQPLTIHWTRRMYAMPEARYLRSALVTSLAAGLVVAQAPDLDEGASLGARLSVQSANPVVAELVLRPTAGFASVRVEASNDAGGPRELCRFAPVLAGQVYRCAVQGRIGSDQNAYVIGVGGVATLQGREVVLARRQFAIPNPGYDRDRAQAQDARDLQRKGRLSTSPSTPPASAR
jgi:hypothetical protein